MGLLLIALVTVCVRAEEEPELITGLTNLKSKPVHDWSVRDVELWMNFTVEFPEYSPYLRRNRVDGPTLLGAEIEHLAENIPLENSLHETKLKAHLGLLKGACLCPIKPRVVDLWALLEQENFRMWVIGTTAMFYPRAGLLMALFDTKTADALTSMIPEPSAKIVVLVLSLLLCPNLFIAFQVGRLVATNYVTAPFFLVYCLVQQASELQVAYGMWHGTVFRSDATMREKVVDLLGLNLFALIPVGALVTSFVFPVVVQQCFVLAFICWVVVVLIGLVLLLVKGDPQASPEHDKSE